MDLVRAWGRYGDRALVTALAVMYAVELLRWDDVRLALAIPFGVAACFLLLLRRQLPVVTVLLVLIAVQLVDRAAPGFADEAISFPLVMLVAIYSLGRWATGLQAWLGLGVVIACIAAFVVDDAGDASDVAFAVAFVGTPWGVGVAMRFRRERENHLQAEAELLRSDQEDSARRAVAAERARIARELHDVVSHAISVTVLQARGGRRLVGVDDAAVRRSLDAIEHTNTAALGDMRRLLAVLRETEEATEGALTPQPSLSRLEDLVEQVRSSGLRVDLEVSGEPGTVPPGVDLSAYRIVQEALTNVLKHAGSKARARVQVTYRPHDVDVAISDDGRSPVNGGEVARPGDGHGLINIRERVAVVGGTVRAGPGPDGGFVVRAHLPYSVDPGSTG
ncbi:histidine kinase, dimerization and phosphoacceptor region [Nocardioides guangzhouensis]|uniref:histidine kinase n=1 Tax=Nocardioides guangzhouensis TaxID=2497878 RepID=A0A4Q4Z3R6_9ACTN|nr:histidine kinase [Nocardioides guangzhouensis]RYP81998.1 histidine kinase, dimerization and phosphoacceptor region [Nocardioides guangzhouensis]